MTRRLIVTADDFGLSVEVNEAVEEAHRNGILTQASLMVAGPAADDAIRRMKRMPDLGVGLHLALHGAPAEAAVEDIPALVTSRGTLSERSVAIGAALALSPALRRQARREIAAQFDAFRCAGLAVRHLDGHWHCHQHPWILRLAIELGQPLGLRTMRIPYEPVRPAGDRPFAGRLLHAASHWPLARYMRRCVHAGGLTANDWFFGKNDAGHMTRDLLHRLIASLPPGVSEIGLHPASRPWTGNHAPPATWDPTGELAALVDRGTHAVCAAHDVRLCRFDDLG